MAMAMFALLSTGIIAGVFTVRADAENNLFESTSQNVAISFLEQTKSQDFESLASAMESATPTINYMIGFGNNLTIPLGQEETITVPIVSNSDGTSKKTLDVSVTINVTEATDFNGYWITVDFGWDHPTRDRSFSGEVRAFKSMVANY